MKNITLVASAMAALALAPTSAMAWNYQGHVTVAEIAYQNLDEAVKVQVDELAVKAYQSMPKDVQHKMDSFEGASQFAKLAMVPDLIRKVPAEQIWEQMGETIPASLNQWEEKETGAWHYINQTYPASSQCDFVHTPNIKLVASYLFEDFKHNPQAASLMFMSHVTGDSHQPMHSISQSLSQNECVTDLGANKHTLDVPQKDLHHLWDSGMGMLDTEHNIHDFAASLQQDFPKGNMALGEVADVDLWVKESYGLADFGYSVGKDTKPSGEYYQKGTELVKQRLTQAGYRLADELNSAYTEQ
ncbi:endonuclease [Photobacterium rosenbergii]|uniref:Endonuclease n=1 Tax=Photobacterium rosenbergii TaxID=294936 RepID=A0A2T3NF32_9GAMM|nr:S1/P1 nuclease [Photobacterium rosenbergii]PSW13152.1 endonuclease [Photobacterium rosenbergii]